MILKYIIENLLLIHKGEIHERIYGSFKLSFISAPFLILTERLSAWALSNEMYITWVLWAIFVDWLVGTGYHFFKKKDFNWGKNFMAVALKIAMVLLCGSLYEALPHFLGSGNLASDTLLATTRLSVFMYPAASAWMNMSDWTDGKFPPTGWINKVKRFEEDLKPLTQDESNNTTN